MSNDLSNQVDQVVNSNASKGVAFVLTPILTSVAGAVSYWLQNKIGIDLPPNVAVGFVVAVVAGTALTAFKWLEGRKEWEQAILQAFHLYQIGNSQPGQAPAGDAPEGTTNKG